MHAFWNREKPRHLLVRLDFFLVAITNVFMLHVYFEVRSFKKDMCGEGLDWTWKGSSFSFVSMAILLFYEQ